MNLPTPIYLSVYELVITFSVKVADCSNFSIFQSNLPGFAGIKPKNESNFVKKPLIALVSQVNLIVS